MGWLVKYSKRSAKRASKLPKKIIGILDTLIAEIELTGPVQGRWPNYGKLGERLHHCHIKKGHPTYVVVWEEVETHIQLVEIQYVGTHEDAPY
jgi:hypothetical protein